MAPSKPKQTAPPAKLTPTERKILALLSDGLPHAREEIHSLLWDELSQRETIRYHISKLRKKLPPGHIIVCVRGYGKDSHRYQHVRLLNSPG